MYLHLFVVGHELPLAGVITNSLWSCCPGSLTAAAVPGCGRCLCHGGRGCGEKQHPLPAGATALSLQPRAPAPGASIPGTSSSGVTVEQQWLQGSTCCQFTCDRAWGILLWCCWGLLGGFVTPDQPHWTCRSSNPALAAPEEPFSTHPGAYGPGWPCSSLSRIHMAANCN